MLRACKHTSIPPVQWSSDSVIRAIFLYKMFKSFASQVIASVRGSLLLLLLLPPLSNIDENRRRCFCRFPSGVRNVQSLFSFISASFKHTPKQERRPNHLLVLLRAPDNVLYILLAARLATDCPTPGWDNPDESARALIEELSVQALAAATSECTGRVYNRAEWAVFSSRFFFRDCLANARHNDKA